MSKLPPKRISIIYPDGTNIFSADEYVIPLYQRAFAWEDKEITQLIEDIADISDETQYYLGALIVFRRGNKFEVVDGQQRLTALYLLLNCLDEDVRKGAVAFACRDKSNYTLENIYAIRHEERSKLDMDRVELGIKHGLEIILDLLQKDTFQRDVFLRNLERTVLYRIEVPEHTDLNRYFEIMNTRGEQLEQHDILKAELLKYLPDPIDRSAFAKIWEACSDMTGYVQMHFAGTAVRDELFGQQWNTMPPRKWEAYRSCFQKDIPEGTGLTIQKLMESQSANQADENMEENGRVRFDSVIEFPFFLLHTLKVYSRSNGMENADDGKPIMPEQLDDKKLVDTFKQVMAKAVNQDRKQFSIGFIQCLLRTRCLYDMYIIKREYTGDDIDGEWSLKTLCASSGKRPYYRDTLFVNKREWYQDKLSPLRNKNNRMIQSALRVSYTSPKAMHWITELLYWLSTENLDYLEPYCRKAESIARDAVREYILKADDAFAMGVNTPHIVFNFLDYLLWNESDKRRKEYKDFVFEFRNSVEHWYPRNPSEGTFEQWKEEDGVNQFGNLCLIQRQINSKFSNMSPEAKKSTFTAMIDKGSLKLRLMRDHTVEKDGKSASIYWKETACKEHGEAMIAKLKKDCGIE